MNTINFEQFKQQKFTAYKNSMGTISTQKGPDLMMYWHQTQKKPTPWSDQEVIAYGIAKNYVQDYGYILDSKNAYVNTGHGHARVEKEEGVPLEETLYKAWVYWQNFEKAA